MTAKRKSKSDQPMIPQTAEAAPQTAPQTVPPPEVLEPEPFVLEPVGEDAGIELRDENGRGSDEAVESDEPLGDDEASEEDEESVDDEEPIGEDEPIEDEPIEDEEPVDGREPVSEGSEAEPRKLERLQKILSQAGVASRRHAEEMIEQGRVQVNGQVVSTLGAKADPSRDHVRVDGKLLHGAERHRYFVLNKPKGFVTTVTDPEGRPTVMEFFSKMKERLYPVGRLDYLSEGLLLVTNDGELANRLTRAASGVEKTYLVKVAGQPDESELERLRSGVAIDRGHPDQGKVHTAPAQIRQVRLGDNPWFEVVLTEGRNRELRKMFEEIGHFVEKIRRVGYGPLVLDLEPGKMRELSIEEVAELRDAAEGKRPVRSKPARDRRVSDAAALPTVRPRAPKPEWKRDNGAEPRKPFGQSRDRVRSEERPQKRFDRDRAQGRSQGRSANEASAAGGQRSGARSGFDRAGLGRTGSARPKFARREDREQPFRREGEARGSGRPSAPGERPRFGRFERPQGEMKSTRPSARRRDGATEWTRPTRTGPVQPRDNERRSAPPKFGRAGSARPGSARPEGRQKPFRREGEARGSGRPSASGERPRFGRFERPQGGVKSTRPATGGRDGATEWTRPARTGPAQPRDNERRGGPPKFGRAGSARPGSARPGSARPGSARPGSARGAGKTGTSGAKQRSGDQQQRSGNQRPFRSKPGGKKRG